MGPRVGYGAIVGAQFLLHGLPARVEQPGVLFGRGHAVTDWVEIQFPPKFNWWTYAMDWRNIVVAECRRHDAGAFTGPNKFRVALLRTTYLPVQLQALMVLYDSPRQRAVFAGFPVYTGFLEGQLDRMLSTVGIGIDIQRDPTSHVDSHIEQRELAQQAATRAQAVASRLEVRFTALTGPSGESVQVYLGESSLAEEDLLLQDGQTFTLDAVKSLEKFSRAVLESANERVLVRRSPQELAAVQIEVQQGSATAGALPMKTVADAPSPATQVTSGQPEDPSPSKAAPSGGCFVATAVYGSYDCPEVRVLRRWRDTALLPHKLGKELVGTYYAFSPHLVRVIGTHRWFAGPVRRALDGLVGYLRRNGTSEGPYRDL